MPSSQNPEGIDTERGYQHKKIPRVVDLCAVKVDLFSRDGGPVFLCKWALWAGIDTHIFR